MTETQEVLAELDRLDARIRGADEAAAVEALNDKARLLQEYPGIRRKRSMAREQLRDRRQVQAEAARREEYDRYMQSQEWKRRRAVAIRKAGGRCQVCNRGGELHVHHRTYERFGAEMEDDLTVLCEDCHDLYERHKRLRRSA